MWISKYNLSKRALKKLLNRETRQLIQSKIDKNYDTNKILRDSIIILANNFCNLSCFSCSATCDKDMGSNMLRDEPRITPIEDIELLLKRFQGHKPKMWIRLTGGEPTLNGSKYLQEVSELCHYYKRKLAILTNGAKLNEVDPFLFDFIELDDHGINEPPIENVVKKLKSLKYKQFKTYRTKFHRDLDLQRKTGSSQVTECSNWMGGAELWKGVLYPCCNLALISLGWDNSQVVEENLIKSGWTLDNENLVETMLNFRETIPAEVLKVCHFDCWLGNGIVKEYPITRREKSSYSEQHKQVSEDSLKYPLVIPASVNRPT